MDEFTLFEPNIAGLSHHANAALLETVAEGSALVLVREPQNAYDQNAVRIDWQGRKLGYVPAMYSPIIAALLDNGYTLRAVVGEVVARKGICTAQLRMPRMEGSKPSDHVPDDMQQSISRMGMPETAIDLWRSWRERVQAMPRQQGIAVWNALLARLDHLGVKHSKQWLKLRIAEEDVRGTEPRDPWA